MILNRAKDFYKTDKERLGEQARDKYRNLSKEEKLKSKNMGETDAVSPKICILVVKLLDLHLTFSRYRLFYHVPYLIFFLFHLFLVLKMILAFLFHSMHFLNLLFHP